MTLSLNACALVAADPDDGSMGEHLTMWSAGLNISNVGGWLCLAGLVGLDWQCRNAYCACKRLRTLKLHHEELLDIDMTQNGGPELEGPC